MLVFPARHLMCIFSILLFSNCARAQEATATSLPTPFTASGGTSSAMANSTRPLPKASGVAEVTASELVVEQECDSVFPQVRAREGRVSSV